MSPKFVCAEHWSYERLVVVGRERFQKEICVWKNTGLKILRFEFSMVVVLFFSAELIRVFDNVHSDCPGRKYDV